MTDKRKKKLIPIIPVELYVSDGEPASLAEVLKWITWKYPDDVFVSINDLTMMRWHAKRLLKELGYKIENHKETKL